MTDPINPDHYKSNHTGVECIQIVEHLDFCSGNAIKYLWRADLKGNKLQDLRKALWYCQRAHALDRPGAVFPSEFLELLEKASQGFDLLTANNISEIALGYYASAILRLTAEIERLEKEPML